MTCPCFFCRSRSQNAAINDELMAYDNGRNKSTIDNDPAEEPEAGVPWYKVLTRVVVG
jgi:hypothetical protein